MEVLNATSLTERLKWEAKEYWLHLEAESPLEKYPAKQHARRVQEKLGVEAGLIYLPGQQAKNNEDSDMPAPFRQHRYFYYLSGCNEPDCHLTYDIQHDTLSLFIPRIDAKRVIWNGRGSTLAEALVKYDIDEVYYSDEISDYLVDWFHHSQNKGSLYFLHGAESPKYSHVLGRGPIDTTSLKPAMNIARMIKDDHEIKLIQRANDISSKAHREVLANILTFNNEAQVQGLFLNVCVSQQAKQQAYDPIAASGPNAGTLHYDANDENFEDRQIMCLDAGCEFELYASDITRTFPLSSTWPSKEAENIYKLVEHMQESCIKRLAPGVRYLDLHILAHQIAIDGLLALGILHNGTKEEIYKAGTSRAFFPHGLGHHIGLEVHDVGQAELMSVRRGKQTEQVPSLYPKSFHLPVYDPKTCHAPSDPQSSHLEEGMVVTVEPGIYFSVFALEHFYRPSPIHSKYINFEVVQRYLPVGGVRIEDDLLITSKGYNNLTTAPKGDAMLEIIRSGNSGKTLFAARKQSLRRKSSENNPPLLRAPGISTDKVASILHPIARSATMPAGFKQPISTDFEPFEGPSLFSNFKRSMTTDERIQHWRRDRGSELSSQEQPIISKQSKSVCGTNARGVRHVYMTSGAHCTPPPGSAFSEHYLPVCKNCTILCETLDRLRKNLDLSEQSAPIQGLRQEFVTTRHRGQIDPHNYDRIATEFAKQTLKEPASFVSEKRAAKAGLRNDIHHPPNRVLSSKQDETQFHSRFAYHKTQASVQKQKAPSNASFQAQRVDNLAPSFIEQFEQLEQLQDNLSGLTLGRSAQLHSTISPQPTPSLEPSRRAQPGMGAMNEHHHEKQGQLHTLEQFNKLEDPIQNNVQRAHEPVQRRNRESEKQAQDTRTLRDLRGQGQKNPFPESMLCRVSTRERGPPSPSLWEKSKMQASASAPESSHEVDLGKLERHIRKLEAQLKAYAPPS